MAATVAIILLGRRWVSVGLERRALVLDVRLEITDPPTNGFILNQEVRYPPKAFQGMTAQQAQQAILEDGVGGVPSLESIALGFLDDWNRLAPIRQLTFPIIFNP